MNWNFCSHMTLLPFLPPVITKSPRQVTYNDTGAVCFFVFPMGGDYGPQTTLGWKWCGPIISLHVDIHTRGKCMQWLCTRITRGRAKIERRLNRCTVEIKYSCFWRVLAGERSACYDGEEARFWKSKDLTVSAF